MIGHNTDIRHFLKLHFKKAQWFFVVFYLVGFFGILLSETNTLFISLNPFAISLSFAGILLFHEGKIDFKTIAVFVVIYFLSLSIELVGVHTGLLFGNYTYGQSLGIKLIQTPIIIGLNWLLLVYLTANIAEFFIHRKVVAIIVASLIMVGYDLVLEPIATYTDMWHWQNNIIPLQNYIAWFVVAVILHSLLKFYGINTRNKIAPLIFFCQLVFFIGLFIFYSIQK
jgi:putative membrane protein